MAAESPTDYRSTRLWLHLIAGAMLAVLAFGRVHAQTQFALVAPFSGPQAMLGIWMRSAATDVVDAINKSGGVAGQKVTLSFYDDQCSPEIATRIAERMRSEKFVAVVGHCPQVARNVRAIYENARIPLVMPNATFQDLGKQASTYVFHVGAREDRLVEAAYDAMRRSNSGNRIAVLSDGSQAAIELTADLRQRGNVVAEFDTRAMPAADIDKRLNESMADTLFLATSFPDRFVTQVRGTRVPVFAPGLPTASNGSWEKFWRDMGSEGSRVRVIGLRDFSPESPIARETFNAWTRRPAGDKLGREKPSAAYSATVAAFEMLFGALSRIGKQTPQALKQVEATREALVQDMRKDPLPTVLGPLRSGEVGEARGALYALHTPDNPWTPAGNYKVLAVQKPPPPSPPPSPPPPPPPSVSLAKTPTPGVFWNSWMERNNAPVKDVSIGARYDVTVDLSRYKYLLEDSASAAASTAIGTEVRNAAARNETEISLTIRPILSGIALDLGDKFVTEFVVKVDITKLAPPATKELEQKQLEDDGAVWRQYVSGNRSLRQISSLFSGTRFSVPVIAREKGCAQVAFSIWDEFGMKPLDHVVYSVSVGEPDACGVGSRTMLNAGFSTLLETVPHPGYPPSRADAALHIFEMPGTRAPNRAIALFVDPTPLAKNEPIATYVWGLETNFGQYVSDATQLLRQITLAREGKDYSAVAREMQARLFAPSTGDSAALALAALQSIVRGSKSDPLVLLRITALQGRPVYLPLGLLFSGKRAIEGRGIRVVHPSPEPLSAQRPTCVNPWTFAVPQVLSQYQGAVVTEPTDGTFIASRRQSTDGDLRAYFRQKPPAKPATTGEGLLLLAHQSKGNIWFQKESERIVFTELIREFAPGSVAVLSACSAASPDSDNDSWLSKMSARGVNTIIASPFPVPLEFGVEFTRKFINAVREAQEKREAPTIASLFAQASVKAAKDLQVVSGDIRHEFVLIGDHDVRLCK